MTPERSADTHPLDQYRDPSDAALVRDLAAEVAAHYGGKLTRMRRANGYSNATWVGDGIAVRIAHTPVDMAREATLVRALPRGVGHPEILGQGTVEGHGWIVTAEVRGQNLHEAWPTLTPAEQQQAVRQLWTRARIVHDASPSLRTHVASHGGFVPATLGDATEAAGRAEVALGLSSAQQSRLHVLIEGYFRAAPLVEQSVNHGDLALMNACGTARSSPCWTSSSPCSVRSRSTCADWSARPAYPRKGSTSIRKQAQPRWRSPLVTWIRCMGAR